MEDLEYRIWVHSEVEAQGGIAKQLETRKDCFSPNMWQCVCGEEGCLNISPKIVVTEEVIQKNSELFSSLIWNSFLF